MIDRYTLLDTEARGAVRRQGRMWKFWEWMIKES